MLVQGGEDFGNLTLTRFYAIHAVVLPAALVLLFVLHRAASRRHGRTPPPSLPDGAAATRYFPGQAFRDVVAFVLVAAAAAAYAKMRGAPLEAPADPASEFTARPEWYFLPLFQLVRLVHGFPGSEFVGSQVIPGLVFLALLLLPWIDRSPSRSPRSRGVALAVGLGPLIACVLLGGLAAFNDANDGELARHQAEAREDAQLARTLFVKNGNSAPPEGPLALLDHHAPRLGKRVFAEKCSACHRLDGQGGVKGPALDGYLSRKWLAGVIKTPQDPRFFGTPGFKETMGSTDAKPDELDALAAFVASQGAPGSHRRRPSSADGRSGRRSSATPVTPSRATTRRVAPRTSAATAPRSG